MKNKCCFIIPYFGTFPNYFELFLKSCEKNYYFTWIIFTDDKTNYHYPKNVQVYYTSFEELKNNIQSKFDFKIALEAPYKLCDFRPSYGYIFNEYIKNFSFWGYCDLDMIMGDLGQFISDELLDEYDKLFSLGHLTLFRNNESNNTLFMSNVGGEYWYRNVFSTPDNLIFDENCHSDKNIHKIFKLSNKRVYDDDLSLNPKILPTRFIKATYNAQTDSFKIDDKKSLYVWDKGHIFRYFIENGNLVREEYLYLHLQERKMTFKDKTIINEKCFKIIPNKFEKLEFDTVTNQNFNKIKKKTLCFHFFQYHFKWKYRGLMKKLSRLPCFRRSDEVENNNFE